VNDERVTWADTREGLLALFALPAFIIVSGLLLLGQVWFITSVWGFILDNWMWIAGLGLLWFMLQDVRK
jgi:hypothetical protein